MCRAAACAPPRRPRGCLNSGSSIGVLAAAGMISPERTTCTMRSDGEAGRLTPTGGNGQRERSTIGPSLEAVLTAAALGVLWRDLHPTLLRYLDAFAPEAA